MNDKDLLKVLVKNALLSQAQADLAESDADSTGMAVDEILIARAWVKQSDIDKVRPSKSADADPSPRPANELSYDDNLKKYRVVLGEILGESSE